VNQRARHPHPVDRRPDRGIDSPADRAGNRPMGRPVGVERPRDRLGRPLPWDGDPALIVESVPTRSTISGSQAWSWALDYLDRDLPFHAHEVFEQRWRCCPSDERLAWQALAQWAAALTHRARGNQVGAQRIARRALANLESATPAAPVDAHAVRASLEHLIGASGTSPY